MSVVLENELENWMGTDHGTRLGKYESRCGKVDWKDAQSLEN